MSGIFYAFSSNCNNFGNCDPGPGGRLRGVLETHVGPMAPPGRDAVYVEGQTPSSGREQEGPLFL